MSTIYLGGTGQAAAFIDNVWFIGKVPVIDENGQPVLGENGRPMWLPLTAQNGGDGVYTATVTQGTPVEQPL